MRVRPFIVGAMVGSLLAYAGVPNAQPRPLAPEPPADTCIVYEHANFSGQRLEVRAGAPMPWVGDRWNDRISAVACAPRCQLTAFEHIDFDGARTDVRTAAFVGPDWNDRISSLEVRCERGGWGRWSERPRGERACTIYWDANFAGRREALEDGADIASIGATWNDQVSAIDCRPGCRLTAYEHVDYRGASREFAGATPFVGPSWNDRISALRVRCL